MDKEKILSQNKKDNLYLDEYEKHIKLKGKSFGLQTATFRGQQGRISRPVRAILSGQF